MKIRSSIKPSLKKRVLFKGSAISILGILLLIGSTFLPRELFVHLGLPTYLISGLFIGIGLIPYRRLSRLELHPYSIEIEEDVILFSRSAKPLFKIPIEIVEKCEHRESDIRYGIAITIKKDKKVKVLQDGMNGEEFSAADCTLFLPFFTEKSFQTFKDQLE